MVFTCTHLYHTGVLWFSRAHTCTTLEFCGFHVHTPAPHWSFVVFTCTHLYPTGVLWFSRAHTSTPLEFCGFHVHTPVPHWCLVRFTCTHLYPTGAWCVSRAHTCTSLEFTVLSHAQVVYLLLRCFVYLIPNTEVFCLSHT